MTFQPTWSNLSDDILTHHLLDHKNSFHHWWLVEENLTLELDADTVLVVLRKIQNLSWTKYFQEMQLDRISTPCLGGDQIVYEAQIFHIETNETGVHEENHQLLPLFERVAGLDY
jgi:hypothetical protein